MTTLEPVTLVAPIDNSTLYCKSPRILFDLNDGVDNLIIYISLENDIGIYNYTSTRNPELFSALAFKAYDKVAFTPKDVCVGTNKITIRVYDNESFSSEQSFIFNYKEPLLAVNNDQTLINALHFKYLVIMTNDTLKAYSKSEVVIDLPTANVSKIYKNYFSIINNNLYDLKKWINDNYPGLNRIYIKDIIGSVKITKKIYNNLLNFIIDL
jgi:hypothetical protein